MANERGTARDRYHHGDLRGALLAAAEELVRERGVAGWSLREASARVGVSPSAAYHHFASRDALVRALAARVLAGLGERMRDAARQAGGPAADPGRGLTAAGCAYVRWALEDPAVARLAFSAGAVDPGTPVRPHPHDVVDEQLDALVAAGRLTPAARAGAHFVVWPAVHGLAVLLSDGLMTLDGPEAVDRQTARVVAAVLAGLAAESADADRPAARSRHTERRRRAAEQAQT